MTAPARPRTPEVADRCPGVLRPHLAADGAMVRVRVPGGQTTGPALARLGSLATAYGSGLLQLTSRGSVQLRGLPEVLPDAFVAGVAEAGFLPSAAHERVRNLAASPLTGLHGGRADLRPMVRALDEALLADPRLADLPGRFLVVLDDGRGDVSGLALDLGYRALDATSGLLLVGDGRHGLPVRADAAVAGILALASRFLDRRTAEWHVAELPAPLVPGLVAAPPAGTGPPPVGVRGEHLAVAVPLGLLGPAQTARVAAVAGDGPLVLTPWRGLVLPGGARAAGALADVGLVVGDASAWTLVSACVGAPWCGNGRADTRALAARLAAAGGPAAPVHLSGCERRCGAPASAHTDLVAPDAAQVDRLVGAGRG